MSWLLGVVSSLSNATASALAGIAPRGVPMATLRTAAYLLWGFLFFVVFQKLIGAFVLIGGLALLAIGGGRSITPHGMKPSLDTVSNSALSSPALDRMHHVRYLS